MTKRKVLLSRTAVRQLDRFPKETQRRIRTKLAVLAEDPYHARAGAGIRLLWGPDDPSLYRLQVGDYRILHFVLEDAVRITEILHRAQA